MLDFLSTLSDCLNVGVLEKFWPGAGWVQLHLSYSYRRCLIVPKCTFQRGFFQSVFFQSVFQKCISSRCVFQKKISFISCSYIQVTVISSVSLSQSVFSKMYDSKVYFQNVFCFILLQKLQLHLGYSYRRCLIVLPATLHSLHSLSLEAAHPVQRGDCSATEVAPSAVGKTGTVQCKGRSQLEPERD